MVTDDGQLYTIEGVAAGMIMLFTAYLVLGATSVYTPGDSHISDMQLEQTGTDALRMMNTPVNGTSESQLTEIVDTLPLVNGAIAPATNAFDPTNNFNILFLNYVNNKTGSDYVLNISEADNLHYTAEVTYYDRKNTTTEGLLISSNRNLTGSEHPVRVTQWVITNQPVPGDTTMTQPRAVLVEVLLWRD
ncbi:MAG: hypothetical protein WCE46_09370 [Methanoregula sp.]|jgi:hypothetical protein|uniref:DUF7288 family protein n=1 Tax=Methanoregula sp. TaxID=2052170 RepID=UPI003C7812B6